MPVRIYEIAKIVGVESKVVVARAKELGIAAAKVPSSSLDKITAEYLIEQLGGKVDAADIEEAASKAKAATPTAEEKKAAKKKPAAKKQPQKKLLKLKPKPKLSRKPTRMKKKPKHQLNPWSLK